MSKAFKQCRYCDAELDRDRVGLNKKIFPRAAEKGFFLCLTCMASGLECTVEDLEERIQEYKNSGCSLFS